MVLCFEEFVELVSRVRDKFNVLVSRSTILNAIKKHQFEVPKAPPPSTAEKPQTEMSWPEIQQTYKQKRREEKSVEEPVRKHHDWPKILDGIRDILFDAKEPMSASSICRALGDNAPAVSGIIVNMYHDERFQMNNEKCWSLAKEEVEREAESDATKKGSAPLERAPW